MANTLTNVLPKLLAQGLLALREQSVMPRLVNRSYENLAQMEGAVINIPIPSAITVRTPVPAILMNSNVDSSPTNVAVTLDFWREAPFQLSDSDWVSARSRLIPMQASEAVKALANAIDDFIFAKHTGIYGKTGTAGTTPFGTNIQQATDARKVLNQNLAPMDDRRVVLDPSAEANFLALSNILQTEQRGDTGGILQGLIGHKLGMDFFLNQNVPSFTPGTGWASGFIASTLSGAIGDTTLNIISATASGTVKIGDMFRLTADTANEFGYVITVAGTASTTVAIAIEFDPPLKTVVDTGATLIVVSIPYAANLAFHRDAFAWASRPLADADPVGNTFQSDVDPISGVALRLELSRQYKQTTYSYDVLGGTKLVRAALATKILG